MISIFKKSLNLRFFLKNNVYKKIVPCNSICLKTTCIFLSKKYLESKRARKNIHYYLLCTLAAIVEPKSTTTRMNRSAWESFVITIWHCLLEPLLPQPLSMFTPKCPSLQTDHRRPDFPHAPLSWPFGQKLKVPETRDYAKYLWVSG